MIVTLNQEPVITLRLVLPLSGVWSARCETRVVDPVPTLVELSDGKYKLHGAVTSATTIGGRLQYRILGGAGGLAKDIEARSYKDSTVREIAESICAASGETLGPCPRTDVAYWTHGANTASHALTVLAEKHGLSWRVLDNGKIWLGVDEFPELDTEDGTKPLVLDRDGPLALLELGLDGFVVRPGMALRDQGRHEITTVEYVVTDALRVHAYHQPRRPQT